MVALRASRLRFTWALWGVPLAYLAWLADWQVGLAFAAATLTAAGGGAYRHFQALERGGEEARELRESTGPLRWAWSRRLAGEPTRAGCAGQAGDRHLAPRWGLSGAARPLARHPRAGDRRDRGR